MTALTANPSSFRTASPPVTPPKMAAAPDDDADAEALTFTVQVPQKNPALKS